jgi:hypothetical protein
VTAPAKKLARQLETKDPSCKEASIPMLDIASLRINSDDIKAGERCWVRNATRVEA